jgi:tRNA (cytidine/uridine-2'-O-)-methyltransferase
MTANKISLAAYEPDIPQNVGAMMRLCAGLGTPLHLIEPFGFPWDIRKIKAVAMDYVDLITPTRHRSFECFMDNIGRRRVILLTTKATTHHHRFEYKSDDILLLGRESAGVPDNVHNLVSARVKIPLTPACRSFNIVTAGAIVLAEALRQTESFAPHE